MGPNASQLGHRLQSRLSEHVVSTKQMAERFPELSEKIRSLTLTFPASLCFGTILVGTDPMVSAKGAILRESVTQRTDMRRFRIRIAAQVVR